MRKAKFATTCSACGVAIQVGDEIKTVGKDDRTWVHHECPDRKRYSNQEDQ
jgi:hypothetical protein